jgi:hypothetical protein
MKILGYNQIVRDNASTKIHGQQKVEGEELFSGKASSGRKGIRCCTDKEHIVKSPQYCHQDADLETVPDPVCAEQVKIGTGIELVRPEYERPGIILTGSYKGCSKYIPEGEKSYKADYTEKKHIACIKYLFTKTSFHRLHLLAIP